MTEMIEAPAAVRRISHWIGGRTVEGESGRSGPVYNPARGRQTGAVDFASADEVDRAVQAAKQAFPGWRATSLSKRSAILFRIRELVFERKDDIARILTAEHGKVFSDAQGEVARGLEVIEYCCGIPALLKGAGVPDGVFNVVHGDKVAVDALLEHPDVAAISFVGSTPIAKYIYAHATGQGKRCQALAGAKNH